jgi:hypothetical protein
MSAVVTPPQHEDLSESLECQIIGGLLNRGLHTPTLFDELFTICPATCFKTPTARAAVDIIQELALSSERLTMQALQRGFKGSGRFEAQSSYTLAEIMECGATFMSDAYLLEEAARLAAEHRREQAAQKLARLQADLQTPFGGRPDDVVAAELADVLEALQGGNGASANTRPLQVDLDDFTGTRFLNSYPPNYEYTLQGSLPVKSLGAIAGPPGAGKGTWSIQAAAALAAGLPVLDTWHVRHPVKVLYLSAEDSPAVIHRRLHHALKPLPPDLQAPAARRIRAVSVSGRVSLCRQASATGLQSTPNLKDLENMLKRFEPGVVFLDTLSRFFAIPENGSDLVTEACGFLEELIQKYGCNFLVLHHVSKASGDCVDKEPELSSALSQFSIRGSGALSACVRWALVLAPLGKKLAGNILGGEAGDKPAGSFVAIRVAKKNIGAPEPRFFFGRDENGVLYGSSG